MNGNQYKDAIRFRNEIVSNNKDRVIIKKEYSKLKQFLTIGIAGTESRIGTTTQSLLICSFFNAMNIKACYISADNKETVKTIENYAELDSRNETMITYKGIDIYKKSASVEAINFGYAFYIYDFGELNDENLDNFISKDIKIIVSGSKMWEVDNLFDMIDKLQKLKEISYLINFTAQEEQKAFLSNMRQYEKTTYFPEYTPNPFATDVNLSLYHRIFKDYLIEKTNKLTIIEKPKKQLLSFLKRGGK